MTAAPRREALRRLSGLALLPLAAAGAGCATPAVVSALRQAPPPGLPRQAHLAGTPFFPQDDDLCGPAVMASLLAAAGRPVDLATLVAQVYLPGRQGTLQAEMLAGARRHGTLAVELAPALPALLQEVAAGRPVAVLLNLALPVWPRWHYAVLVGYDLARGSARLHSGTRADDEWPLATLEYTWARSGHWAFIALAPGQLPVGAEPQAVARALLALDRSAAPLDAAPTWAAAARRWPDHLTLAVGEANAWLAAGQLEAAARAFEQAGARFDSAVAWNNLARVRQRQGERAAAVEAARRAVARAEAAEPRWLDAAQRTLSEVSR